MLTPMLSILQVISSSHVFIILWYIGIYIYMCLLYFGISDSYGLLYYQDYVPNIALTTVNDFLLKILRHYLHFFLLLSCCDAYK